MKTPEKIKKSIRECLGFHSDCEDVCDACPYWDEGPFCKGALCRDTIACIDQMEERLSLNTLRDAIYEDAVAHGLWDENDGTYRCARKIAKEASELIEAAEDLSVIYHDTHDYANTSSHYAEELADVIIMSLSVAGKLGIDIDAQVRRKMEINRQRPWKHGKEDA